MRREDTLAGNSKTPVLVLFKIPVIFRKVLQILKYRKFFSFAVAIVWTETDDQVYKY